ncbi:MAG: hypothetical protein OXB84_07390 [Halobacteriovoraceae bacterium]|nr:hypothetical protein [Halobacteriovoraceae bacterium]
MKKILIFTFLLCFIDGRADTSTKKLMRKVFEDYVKLIPYMYGTKNKGMIVKLNNLEQSFLKARHDKMLGRPMFSPIAEIFKENISDIKKGYQIQNTSYAKHRLKVMNVLCISCHSQLPRKRYPRIINKYSEITNKYIRRNRDKAMLSYFLRDYETSIKYFKKEFEETSNQNESVIRTILNIYVTNLDNENKAVKYLRSISNNKKTPKGIKKSAKEWTRELIKPFNRKNDKKSVKKLISRVNNIKDELNINSRLAVEMFRMKRTLNNYMTKKTNTKLMPEILYSLGLLTDRQGDIYLYSLGEMYLKKCIINYPKSDIAKDCYTAYKDSVYFGFTGSSGTHIPPDIKKELKTLESKIKNPKSGS